MGPSPFTRLRGLTFATALAVAAPAFAQPAAQPGAAPTGAERIRLNQIGFYPTGPKTAVVVGGDGERFAVLTADRGDTAFVGALAPARRWDPSGEDVRRADFGRLTKPGRYVLAVAGIGRSSPFAIDSAILRPIARMAVKAFYFQRVSTALPARYAGAWARAAGHPDSAVLVHPSAAGPGRPAGTRIAAPGGWYDAGDYNKYVVNSGISTYTLLLLAEQFPRYAAMLGTNIPESGNGLPDVLNEALWNLRWMRRMQDPADGGVYHKLTTAEFSGFVMPAADTAPRYVVQKSTAAALDFAAVAAHAAMVLRPYDHARGTTPGLADSLVREAMAAWNWARQHPDSLYDQGRLNARTVPPVRTGDYGDRTLGDEFRWAGAELALATERDSFVVAARRATPHDSSGAANTAVSANVPSWGDVGTLASYSLLERRRTLPAAVAAAADTAALARGLLAQARTLVDRARGSAYAVAIDDPRDFTWGSNAVAANQGMLLVQAYRLTGDAAFLQTAAANLDYLLGRNATGRVFVTGAGATAPRFPHHRPSAADGIAAPVPGFLVGGPNPGQQDHCAGYPSRLPALSYVDSTCAYAANEVAINWNAPLAYLAAAVDALSSPEGARAFAPRGAPTDGAGAGRGPGRGRRD